MSNVLNEQTKQQLVALGRLGWSLRRIQKTAGVRRETVAAYLKISWRPHDDASFLQKPYSPVALAEKIAQVLEKR